MLIDRNTAVIIQIIGHKIFLPFINNASENRVMIEFEDRLTDRPIAKLYHINVSNHKF